MKTILVALLTAVLLSGCTHQKLTPQHRDEIKTVRVLPVIYSPGQMTYMGREQAWGMALGAGAGVAAGAAAGTSRLASGALSGAAMVAGKQMADLATMPTVDAILYVMESEHIDLGQNVRKSFADRLVQKGPFNVVGEEDPADADIQLSVTQWGFALTQGFSSLIYPTITVNAVMKRGNEVLWQKTESITAFNGANTYGHTPLQYRTEPVVLGTALTGIAQIVSQYLVDDVQK